LSANRNCASIVNEIASRSACPGIDQLDPEILEVANVTSSERRPPRSDDSGDFDISKLQGLPDYAALRSAIRGFHCCIAVEGQNSSLEILIQDATERILKLPSATSGSEQLNAEADFKHCHGCSPNCFRGLLIKPLKQR
jgi:hypothetical protein